MLGLPGFAPSVSLAWNSPLMPWLCFSHGPSPICHCLAVGARHWLCLSCDPTTLNPSILAFSTSHDDRLLVMSLLIQWKSLPVFGVSKLLTCRLGSLGDIQEELGGYHNNASLC